MRRYSTRAGLSNDTLGIRDVWMACRRDSTTPVLFYIRVPTRPHITSLVIYLPAALDFSFRLPISLLSRYCHTGVYSIAYNVIVLYMLGRQPPGHAQVITL